MKRNKSYILPFFIALLLSGNIVFAQDSTRKATTLSPAFRMMKVWSDDEKKQCLEYLKAHPEQSIDNYWDNDKKDSKSQPSSADSTKTPAIKPGQIKTK